MTGSAILLLLTPSAPLLAALALAPARWRDAALRWSPVAALPALVLAVLGPLGQTVTLPWLVQQTSLGLDPTGRIFLGFSSVLWLTSGWYARGYLAADPHRPRFQLFFLLAMAGNFGLILAQDVSTFYVCFALMGLASGGLVLHGGDVEAVRAGRVYLALAMVGEALLLAGFAALVVEAGTTRIDGLYRESVSTPALLALLIGFGIKSGAFTLHFWLPLAHPAAPVPASAVLSGAMIKAGLLGWLRFLPLGEVELPALGYGVITAGLLASLLGTVAGVAQLNPKTVLAYSSISQMGIITCGIGIGLVDARAWPAISAAILVYAAHHALAKGALFLGIGPAQQAATRARIALARAALTLPALALAGAPFTSGALAKVALKSNVGFLPAAWADALSVLLPLAAVGTTLKMARFLWLVWPRGTSAAIPVTGLWAPWLAMVLAVMVGVWMLPGALTWLSDKASPAKLWTATWPLLAGGVLAALGAVAQRYLPFLRPGIIPAGDIVVLLERAAAFVSRRAGIAGSRSRRGAEAARSRDWSAALAERLQGAERTLRSWPVVGAAITVSVAALYWLLSGTG